MEVALKINCGVEMKQPCSGNGMNSLLGRDWTKNATDLWANLKRTERTKKAKQVWVFIFPAKSQMVSCPAIVFLYHKAKYRVL